MRIEKTPFNDNNNSTIMKKALFTTALALLGILVFTGCSKDDNNDGSEDSKGQKPKGLEAVDLGLPSGTKWANMNVGATKPEGFGGYYAWGETEEKDVYDWITYIHCDGSPETCHDLGKSICGTEYDVAHVKWGDNWQMPSVEQIEELLDKCESEWIELHSVPGFKFTGPNGNSIFLPAAGNRYYSNHWYLHAYGHYWSGTLLPDNDSGAYSIYFQPDLAAWNYNHYGLRDGGFPVRPVSK